MIGINTYFNVYKFEFLKILFSYTFLHTYFLNLGNSTVPLLMFMKLLPVIDDTHIEGTVSQFVLYRFLYLILSQKRETFCYIFFNIYSSFYKMRTKT